MLGDYADDYVARYYCATATPRFCSGRGGATRDSGQEGHMRDAKKEAVDVLTAPDTAFEFLREFVSESPVKDDRGFNRCRFCDGAWPDLNGGHEGHEPDCWWLRAKTFLAEMRLEDSMSMRVAALHDQWTAQGAPRGARAVHRGRRGAAACRTCGQPVWVSPIRSEGESHHRTAKWAVPARAGRR